MNSTEGQAAADLVSLVERQTDPVVNTPLQIVCLKFVHLTEMRWSACLKSEFGYVFSVCVLNYVICLNFQLRVTVRIGVG